MQDRSGTHNAKGKKQGHLDELLGIPKPEADSYKGSNMEERFENRALHGQVGLHSATCLTEAEMFEATQMICWFFSSSQTAFEQQLFLSTAFTSEDLKDE